MATDKELEGLRAFAEEDFNKVSYANKLLLSNNNNDSNELDLVTPLKKLKFDHDECDKRMSKIISSNYDTLISSFSQVEQIRDLLSADLKESIERINSSFQRIRKDVITPYEDSLKMNNALRRIHATMGLLRGVGSFLLLIQQVVDAEKAAKNNEKESDYNKDTLRLAKLYEQVLSFYEFEKDIANNKKGSGSSLLMVKIIRDYESILTNRRMNWIDGCTKFLSGELTHKTALTPSNSNLQFCLKTLYVLNQKELIHSIEDFALNRQSQICATQLSKYLQSPRNITTIILQERETSQAYLQKLHEVLSTCDIQGLKVNALTSSKTVIDEFELINKSTIEKFYWNNAASKFKKSIASTMALGGPKAKNLRVYFEGIKKFIDENIDGIEHDLLTDAIELMNRPSK
ncbi:Piso0_002114 [Millerozyma farinosa CBS 7064]|uniref:Conserved oligomeric Golgi complex subunit 5 n=1 Tax=Pichia sorbitophila (strain ATCC MYA-4447 / BCRC 22081 / CBS 7064 / NBRC 10061 / NRRL Y-12695) TaxID=559304 RepID=G8YBQ8_PICSO|nr:Piso0_002114 [Millerozyma farinosa CBS 7064]